jgi:hypothetical protein
MGDLQEKGNLTGKHSYQASGLANEKVRDHFRNRFQIVSSD